MPQTTASHLHLVIQVVVEQFTVSPQQRSCLLFDCRVPLISSCCNRVLELLFQGPRSFKAVPRLLHDSWLDPREVVPGGRSLLRRGQQDGYDFPDRNGGTMVSNTVIDNNISSFRRSLEGSTTQRSHFVVPCGATSAYYNDVAPWQSRACLPRGNSQITPQPGYHMVFELLLEISSRSALGR